jgi:hypothetical protein
MEKSPVRSFLVKSLFPNRKSASKQIEVVVLHWCCQTASSSPCKGLQQADQFLEPNDGNHERSSGNDLVDAFRKVEFFLFFYGGS